jgi:hypothetical protein
MKWPIVRDFLMNWRIWTKLLPNFTYFLAHSVCKKDKNYITAEMFHHYGPNCENLTILFWELIRSAHFNFGAKFYHEIYKISNLNMIYNKWRFQNANLLENPLRSPGDICRKSSTNEQTFKILSSSFFELFLQIPPGLLDGFSCKLAFWKRHLLYIIWLEFRFEISW